MKYFLLIIVSILLTGLVIGGALWSTVQKLDFWILVTLPLFMIWIGWKLFTSDDKVLKGTGIFTMTFFILCWIGVFFSQRIRTCLCSILRIKDYITPLYGSELNWSFWKILLLWILDWILCFVFGIFKTDGTDPPQETTDTPPAPTDDTPIDRISKT